MSRQSRKASLPSTEQPAPAQTTGHAWLIAARVLLCVALAVSAYLAWVSLSHGSVIGCGPESDCERVLSSRWARWFGVPVSVFAMLVDALTLWGTFQIGRSAPRERAERGWFMVTLGSVLITGAALWFVGLQVYDGHFCPYCMAAHLSGAAAAALLLVRAGKDKELPARVFSRARLCAAAGLALLVAGQYLHRPKTGLERKDFAAGTNLAFPTASVARTGAPASLTSITSVATAQANVVSAPPTNVPPTNAALASAGNTTSVPPAPAFTPGAVPVSAMKRAFAFYEGRVAVDLEDIPLVGAPTNTHALVSLFDYTCHHCREMHPLLEEAQRAFSNQLSIVSLPAPLDAECNRTMTRTPRAHSNACNYARLGLIVWRANREKHYEFEQFMFSGAEAPPFPAAVGRAVQLVGTNAITRAAADPWVEERLQFSLALYEAAYKRGEGRMPQMIVGRSVAVGSYPREELYKLLADNLGLKKAP